MKPWRTNTSPPSRISTWPWASAALPWPPCPRPSRPRPTSPGGLRPPQPMLRINQPDLVSHAEWSAPIMPPFLRLHALAAQRGDGLHPELLALFERLEVASEPDPTGATIITARPI